MPRRFPIVQFPNAPMIASIAARIVSRRAGGETARIAGFLADAALLLWAYEEITDGANWFRRLVGVGGVALAVRGPAMRAA